MRIEPNKEIDGLASVVMDGVFKERMFAPVIV